MPEPGLSKFVRESIADLSSEYLTDTIKNKRDCDPGDFVFSLINEFLHSTAYKIVEDRNSTPTPDQQKELQKLAKLHVLSVLSITEYLELPTETQTEVKQYIEKYCPTNVEQFADKLIPNTPVESQITSEPSRVVRALICMKSLVSCCLPTAKYQEVNQSQKR